MNAQTQLHPPRRFDAGVRWEKGSAPSPRRVTLPVAADILCSAVHPNNYPESLAAWRGHSPQPRPEACRGGGTVWLLSSSSLLPIKTHQHHSCPPPRLSLLASAHQRHPANQPLRLPPPPLPVRLVRAKVWGQAEAGQPLVRAQVWGQAEAGQPLVRWVVRRLGRGQESVGRDKGWRRKENN